MGGEGSKEEWEEREVRRRAREWDMGKEGMRCQKGEGEVCRVE